MGIQAMKMHHQLPRGLIWDHDPPSLTLGCKRFRPLAPKLPPSVAPDTLSAATTTTTSTATFDLKSFIKADHCSPRKPESSDIHKKESSSQVEAAAPGGTRWNPTQEQIGILEMLYRNGMRTPNAQQIEQITLQLSKYGKIEGKNVFYWFQNHKARERQKQKRTSLGLSPSMRTPPPPYKEEEEEELVENNRYKRKCTSWAFDERLEEVTNKYCREEKDEEEEEGQDRTLKLFPLHPEGRSCLRDY